jgi:hypothetical protein
MHSPRQPAALAQVAAMTACQQATQGTRPVCPGVAHPAAHNPPPPQTAAPALPDTSSQQGPTGRNRPAHSPPTHTRLDERQPAGETAAAGAGAHTDTHPPEASLHTHTRPLMYCSMLCSACHCDRNTHGGTGGGRAAHSKASQCHQTPQAVPCRHAHASPVRPQPLMR